MRVTAAFANADRWAACYKRNNKVGGAKNLRCFPHCRDDGHCERGFCGSSVLATLMAARAAPQPPAAAAAKVNQWVGEFVQCTCPVREVCPEADTLYEGRLLDGDCVVVFEPGRGWHYTWTAYGNSPDILHVFRMYALDCARRVVGFCDSPQFSIVSSRAAVPQPPPSLSSSLQKTDDGLADFTELSDVLNTMHDRVQDAGSPVFEVAAPSAEELNAMFHAGAVFELCNDDERRILAIERMDALLLRLYAQIESHHRVAHTDSATFYRQLRTDLESFLGSEGLTASQLVLQSRELYPARDTGTGQPPATVEALWEMARSAALAASRVCHLCDGFMLGGSNDVSGHWRAQQPLALVDKMSRVYDEMGASTIERRVWEQFDRDFTICVLSASSVQVTWHGASYGADRTMVLHLNRTNPPAARRPLQLPSACGVLLFPWAHVSGFVFCMHLSDTLRLIKSYALGDLSTLVFRVQVHRFVAGQEWTIVADEEMSSGLCS